MAYFKDIIGQEQIKEHLQNAIATGKISHAYIINGERFAGKEFIAKMLRPFFHSFTRFRRKCIGAHCPEILTPVFFAVVER